jgi:Glyoxalase-like domain
MTCRLEMATVDCADPRRLAEFWCVVLDYVVHEERDDLVEIGPKPVPAEERLAEIRRGPVVPTIEFARVPDPKSSKNRLHLDVCPIEGSQQDELERLLALGATRVDVGQGDGRSWSVLADPEGNEFCLLRSLAPGHFSL